MDLNIAVLCNETGVANTCISDWNLFHQYRDGKTPIIATVTYFLYGVSSYQQYAINVSHCVSESFIYGQCTCDVNTHSAVQQSASTSFSKYMTLTFIEVSIPTTIHTKCIQSVFFASPQNHPHACSFRPRACNIFSHVSWRLGVKQISDKNCPKGLRSATSNPVPEGLKCELYPIKCTTILAYHIVANCHCKSHGYKVSIKYVDQINLNCIKQRNK